VCVHDACTNGLSALQPNVIALSPEIILETIPSTSSSTTTPPTPPATASPSPAPAPSATPPLLWIHNFHQPSVVVEQALAKHAHVLGAAIAEWRGVTMEVHLQQARAARLIHLPSPIVSRTASSLRTLVERLTPTKQTNNANTNEQQTNKHKQTNKCGKGGLLRTSECAGTRSCALKGRGCWHLGERPHAVGSGGPGAPFPSPLIFHVQTRRGIGAFQSDQD
jgi:hypothetical protein